MKPKTDIQEVEPDEALEKYLQHRQHEVTESTLDAHRYRLQHFVRYCDKKDITYLSDLTGRDLQDYRHWRQQDGDLKLVTVHTQLATLRVFIQWAESYDALPEGFHERVRVPDLPRNADVDDEKISSDRAFDIIDYLSKYEYASGHHTLFALMWFTGLRMGALRAIDLDDIYEGDRGPYIELRHRPETGTPLKNGDRGQRAVSLHPDRYKLVQDYIEARRHDVTDEYGRDPLFTTDRGRLSKTALRYWIYEVTRPCVYAHGECPHDRDPESCEWTQQDQASKCPSSVSPHTIRRSSITYWLSEDVDREHVSGRMDVTEDVLEKHYDKRTEIEKMEQRRDAFGQ